MKKNYDIVIIGAGIGGLVCGCYLTNAGFNVLIVEKHNLPGGCCSSFNRKGYNFDVGVHYIGGVKNGVFGRILDELELRKEIAFSQSDPTDKIIMPDFSVNIRSKCKNTILELSGIFPKEALNIKKFFNFLANPDQLKIYNKVKNITFKELLNNYFQDYKLKGVFNALLRNLGTCSGEISAWASIVLFREYIFDPGYYPVGGMQALPDMLVRNLRKKGADVILSQKAIEIVSQDNIIQKIKLENGKIINTKVIVSNIDALDTFKNLLKCETKELNKILHLKNSPALFAVYLGLKQSYPLKEKNVCSIWPFFSYDLDKKPILFKDDICCDKIFISLISFPSCHNESENKKFVVELFASVSASTSNFWDKYKDVLAESIIKKAGEVIPSLKDYVEVKVIATPDTFSRYTANSNGAAFGWLSTIEQTKITAFPLKTSIKGLYLTGHWTTMGSGQGGVPRVAFSGRKTAYSVTKFLNKEWKFNKNI